MLHGVAEEGPWTGSRVLDWQIALRDLGQLNSFANEVVSIGSCRASCSSGSKQKEKRGCIFIYAPSMAICLTFSPPPVAGAAEPY